MGRVRLGEAWCRCVCVDTNMDVDVNLDVEVDVKVDIGAAIISFHWFPCPYWSGTNFTSNVPISSKKQHSRI